MRRGAFTPTVDVYYVADPPRAVVRAELAGVRAAEIELEIRGRELILAGHRHGADAEEERVYQQLEIQHGPFRRVISLGADVDADAAKADLRGRRPHRRAADPRPGGRPPGADPPRGRGRLVIEIATPGAGEEEVAMGASPPLPAALPVLPLRDTVTFPDTLTPLAVGQERSIQLVNDVLGHDRMLALVASRDPEIDSPRPEQLHTVGVVGTVARMLKVPDGTLRILVQSGPRIRLEEFTSEQPYLVAAVAEAPDALEEGPELTALVRNVQQTFGHIIEDVPYLPEELSVAVANLDDPSALAHLIAGALRIKTEEKQALLEELDVAKRLRRLSEILARELEVAAIGSRIQSQVQSELDRSQREYVLRQQLKAIQEELGERDPAEAETDELREQLAAVAMPEDVRKQADRELGAAGEAPAGGGRVRRDPHVPGVARLAALGRDDRRTTSTSATRARCSTTTTTTSRRSRTASSSSSPCAGSSRTRAARSSASSARPASARPRSATRSRARSAATSSASAPAACATRPRSAATAAPTSARCRARSSARCATRARPTRCS